MKIIRIDKNAVVSNTRTIHGVNVPSSFNSEEERSALLDTLFDLDLTKPQVTEVRNAIKAVKVTAQSTSTVEQKYIQSWSDLYGSFDQITGRSQGGTSDLVKDWNLTKSYDCGDALFQLITGVMKLLCYESKDVTSTIFNSAIKRAVNNIKSDLVSFQTKNGQPNTTVCGDRSTLEESQVALEMIMDRVDALIEIINTTLDLIDGSAEALGGAVTLANVQAYIKQLAENKAKAEAKSAETKPVEAEQPQAAA